MGATCRPLLKISTDLAIGKNGLTLSDHRIFLLPSLIRFLVFCAILVGIGYGAMYALVVFVEPKPKEVQVRIPSDRLNLP